MTHVLPILLALAPVLVFLALLRGADTFRLVPVRATLRSVAVGGAVALLAALVHRAGIIVLELPPTVSTRVVGPVLEELLKAAWVLFLLRRHRIGFQVDAALHGFAVGAGFALVENVSYLWHAHDAPLTLWVVRGFGTAVMHGCATAIFAIVAKELHDRDHERPAAWLLVPVLASIALHALFNHFYLPALTSTLVMVVVFPLLTLAVLLRSERTTRRWLHSGFDNDAEVLGLLFEGELPSSPIGAYLETVRHRFAPDVVADMVAYLQVGLELSLEAKGRMMAREAGLQLPIDPETLERIDEFRWLERRLGPAGRLALSPLVLRSSRDLWQIFALDEEHRAATR